jgi:hypothetical protein
LLPGIRFKYDDLQTLYVDLALLIRCCFELSPANGFSAGRADESEALALRLHLARLPRLLTGGASRVDGYRDTLSRVTGDPYPIAYRAIECARSLSQLSEFDIPTLMQNWQLVTREIASAQELLSGNLENALNTLGQELSTVEKGRDMQCVLEMRYDASISANSTRSHPIEPPTDQPKVERRSNKIPLEKAGEALQYIKNL